MRRWIRNRRGDAAGVSLPELLVVIAVLALVAMVSVPLISQRVHKVRCRAAAGQFAVALRAARMVAVSNSSQVTVAVSADDNTYQYIDSQGNPRLVELPQGVEIDAASTGDIVFEPNGALTAAATTIITVEFGEDNIVERWIIDTSLTGIPVVEREKATDDEPPPP